MDLSTEAAVTDIRTYIDALASHDAATITAASLGRIQQHVSNLREKQFAILTPFRRFINDTPVTPAENRERLVSFKQNIRSRGYGYIPMTGHWTECMDQVPYTECAPDRKIDSTEPSFLIPNMTLEEAISLGKKYQQDGIIYGGPATEGHVKVIFMGGREEDLGDTVTTQKIKQGFSSLDPSRKFSFFMLNEESPMSLQAASLYATRRYGKMPYSLVTGMRVL
jgi:hypothetical protein